MLQTLQDSIALLALLIFAAVAVIYLDTGLYLLGVIQ